MTRYSITLDLSKYTTQLSLSCKNTDVGREIAITLHQNGVPYTLTADNYAVFVAKNSSGADIVNDCVVDLVNNCVVYKITPQTIANGGNIPCEIQLFGYDREQIGSPTFNILVRKSILGETNIESSHEYGTLNVIINDIRRSLEAGEFDGKSAYQYAVEYGYEGSEEEFGLILAELKTYKEYTDQHLLDHDEAIAELKGDNEQLYMIADELVAMNETTAKRVDFCEKRITNFEKGLPAERFVTDDSVAHVKHIPTNACPYAAVEKVGGMTYRDGDTLMPTKVTAIEIAGANLFDPATLIEGGATEDNGEYYFIASTVYNYWQGKSVIPIEYLKPNTQYIIGLEGYNENETGRADSFGFNVSYTDGSGNSEIFTSTQDWSCKQIITRSGKTVSSVRFTYKNGGYNHLRKVFIAEYTGKNTYTPYKTNTFNIPTEVQDLDGYGEEGSLIEWRTDGVFFNGTDISDLITADNLIEVEGGGTLTFVNEYGAAVPSTILYQVKGE